MYDLPDGQSAFCMDRIHDPAIAIDMGYRDRALEHRYNPAPGLKCSLTR